MKVPKPTIILISCFLIFILSSIPFHFYYLQKDFKMNVNFLVKKKERQANSCCHVFDKNMNEFPLQSLTFNDSQINEGDSIVKKSNSYLVIIYRKRNYLYENGDNKYFVAEKISLE